MTLYKGCRLHMVQDGKLVAGGYVEYEVIDYTVEGNGDHIVRMKVMR